VSLITRDSIPPSLFSNIIIPPTQSNISKIINLNVTVEDELNPFQMFRDFWDTYGEFISFIGAGFAGGAATYFFDYLKTRRK
jgi:hypothetical protein